MQRYTNLVQDNAGNALGGVTVTVYAQGTTTLSTLYSGNGVTSLANPFTNDTDGTLEFYATNGRYDIVFTKTGYTFTAANTTDVTLFDPLVTGTTFASPVFSGTTTGTYTIGGTVTITAPILSGTVTGTYTLGGTSTLTSPTINTPTITTPTMSSPTITGTLVMTDAVFRVLGSSDATKVMNFEADGMTAGMTLTLASVQSASQTLTVPNITASDTLVTLGLAQVVTGVKTMTNMTTAAGTTTVPSLTVTGGTNLTSVLAGAVENDAIAMYMSTNTTDGRAHVPARQHFRLTADGSAITTIGNFFGTTSNISLVASAYYAIEIVLYFLKTTTDTVVITLTNSAAPTSQNIWWEQAPATGVVAPPGTATLLVGHAVKDTTAAKAITTGALTTANDHAIRIRLELQNGTGTSLKIQATSTSGSVTPRLNSFWTATRLPTGNTGTFSA